MLADLGSSGEARWLPNGWPPISILIAGLEFAEINARKRAAGSRPL